MTPRAGDEIWIERRKYPDQPHYGTDGVVLGDDEHGIWVGAQIGSTIVMPDGTVRSGERRGIWCLPHDDWFLLHWWYGHPRLDLYVDICTPPVWNERGARMIDLDFDVVRWNAAHGGGVELIDEDEFEEHRRTLRYPEALVEGARAAAIDVFRRVENGDPPFDRATQSPWLELVPPA